MPLYQCVHCVDAVTAKVPLAMIILADCVQRRSLPSHLKCRMIVPTSGLQSTSLWDAPSQEDLQAWVDANLNQDCTSIIAEVSVWAANRPLAE